MRRRSDGNMCVQAFTDQSIHAEWFSDNMLKVTGKYDIQHYQKS